MNNFEPEYRDEIKQFVSGHYIDPRPALHGGRVECFKTYHEVLNELAKILGVDVSSLYPAVMSLDYYAVGCKQIKNYTVEEVTKRVLSGSLCGLVKCDIVCPKGLYVPILPSKTEKGSLVFNLLDKYEQVDATPELQLALQNGYIITKVYNCHAYKTKKGLFKPYVQFFYKMKIVNTRHYTPEECVELNKYFRSVDFDIVIKSEETRNNGGLRGVAKLF
jgi:hypothetical protein